MTTKLDGVTVAVLVADGFEQVEVTGPMRALERAGATLRVISLRPGRLRGMNMLWPGRKISVDDTVDHAVPEHFGALLLPGGFVNPDLLRQSARALELVRRMNTLGRPIAVICHGPAVLVSAGLVRDRRIASWPGISDDIRNAGGQWVDEPVVRDGNWVSSRSPADLPAFEDAMVSLFAEVAPRGLPRAPRPALKIAVMKQVATMGAGAMVVTGIAAPLLGRHLRMQRTEPKSRMLPIVHDLSLAAAFGGMLYAKAALDPAARVLPHLEDRGRMIVTPWRAFVAPAAVSLSAAAMTWLAGERRRAVGRAAHLAYAKDGLLVASLVTGAINAVAGVKLSRANTVPMQSGVRPAQAAGELAKVHRVGLVSGYGHLVALAGTLVVGALLRRGRR